VSSRVILRSPTLQHEATFLEAARRSKRLHRDFAQPPLTRDAFRAFLSRAKRPSCESHLVFDAPSQHLVGVINLNEIVRGSFQSAYLGYYAFEPFSGQGFMRAGMVLVLQRAFGELGLHRVEANIQPENERSIALVRRLGFRREGFSPRYLKVSGRWRDHERWALLRETWPGVRAAARRAAEADGRGLRSRGRP
jgi:ribosomal-protein-alanine N-acetyltransferase